MSRELQVYNSFGELILHLEFVAGDPQPLQILNGTEQMRAAVRSLSGQDLDLTVYVNKQYRQLSARWGVPEYVDTLAEYWRSNFGWRTKITSTMLTLHEAVRGEIGSANVTAAADASLQWANASIVIDLNIDPAQADSCGVYAGTPGNNTILQWADIGTVQTWKDDLVQVESRGVYTGATVNTYMQRTNVYAAVGEKARMLMWGQTNPALLAPFNRHSHAVGNHGPLEAGLRPDQQVVTIGWPVYTRTFCEGVLSGFVTLTENGPCAPSTLGSSH